MKRAFLRIFAAAVVLLSAAALQDACAAGRVKLPKGTTVYGQVVCDGQPMAGVCVSDGREIVKTDAKGMYYLKSAKEEGTVFVSFPGGTTVPVSNGMPAHWRKLESAADVAERHDFTLTAVDNSSYAFLAVSDIHLANLNDDIRQFTERFMPRVREEVGKYESAGRPVYCLNAGDSSFDRYWYEYLYSIGDFPGTLADVKYPVPMFTAMGNHDNNGAVPREGDVDWHAAAQFRETMGPSYYSFNIGEVHYIILDNIVYLNEEGRIDSYEGITGKRNYECWIRDDEMEWLRKDLALIEDKSTPVVVTMHIPVMGHKGEVETAPIVSKMHKTGSTPDEQLREFSAAFRGFEQVHFVSGHSHKSRTTRGSDDCSKFPDIANIIDHNVGGVCGAWWQTASRGGLMLAPNSAPAGFEVFTVDGKQLKWYFVSIDDGAQKQFRVFDMNSVRDFYRSNGEVRAMMKHYPERVDYSDIEDNVLLIHVWAWENGWKLSVKENGVELPAKALKAENPQYFISHAIPKACWEDNGTGRWPEKYAKSTLYPHFFRVQASAPDSEITVTVTDGFGRTWSETVTRPKPFSKTMR